LSGGTLNGDDEGKTQSARTSGTFIGEERLRPRKECEKGAYNLAYEAFLLHFRNLAEFYAKPEKLRRKETDVFAWEFSKGRKLKLYGQGTELRCWVEKMNPRVTHLSTIRHPKTGFNLGQMLGLLEESCRAWIDDLDQVWYESFGVLRTAVSGRFQSPSHQMVPTTATSASSVSFGSVVYNVPHAGHDS
jgi:hypothetical protein